jgi:hypothetical protein
MGKQMAMLLGAMASVLLTWGALFLVFVGVGLLALRAFRLRATGWKRWLACFWVGWTLALVLLQIWHLWFAVDWRALTAVTVLGAAGLAGQRGELWRAARRLPKEWLFCAVMLAVAARLANRAVGLPDHIDAGYYHFAAIRWAQAYPIVPGLGNLHNPLAINSAHFLYVAMLDVGPWAHRAQHLANGLLLMAALAGAFAAVFAVCRRAAVARRSELFLALCMPALWTQAAFDPSAANEMFIRLVSSPTPDLPVFVLGLVAAGQLLAFIEDRDAQADEAAFSLFSIAAVTVAGSIVKLTFAAYGATALVVALAVWGVRHGRRAGAAWALLLSSALVVAGLVPWAVRSVILSGYVAYPVPAAAVGVDWRVPIEVVVREAATVRGHAQWSVGSGGWGWLGHWVSAVAQVAMATIVLPLGATVAVCLVVACARLRRRFAEQTPRALYLFFVPAGVALAFWFLTAPNPRFAGALFWVAAAGVTAMAVNALARRQRGVAVWAALGSAGVVSAVIFLGMSVNGPGADKGFHPIPQVAVVSFVTRSGLTVFVPGNDILCWDAPLPCTPLPRRELRLRREGDMARGFVLDLKPGSRKARSGP